MTPVPPPAKLLNTLAGTGTGSSIDLGVNYATGVVQVIMTGTATVELQASLDDVNFVDVHQFTASDAKEVLCMRYMRGNVSSYTSGTVDMLLGLG